jgi:class 3 adenylate cyclase
VAGPPEIRYARNGDVNLAYQVSGDGPLDLVVVPGFVSHLEILWDEPSGERFASRLGSFSRLLRYDKREQGLSDRLGKPPTLEQSMEDLRAVMDAAGVERAALFGISEGGPMCQLFAATFPERVSALILYGTFARMVDSDNLAVGTLGLRLERLKQWMLDEWGGPVALSMFAPSMLEDERFSRWWARLLRSGTSPQGAVALLSLYAELDARPVLGSISAPTLVIHRSEDVAVPIAHSHYLAEHIPGARLVMLPGGDHIPMAGDQEGILEEVEEFLTGTRQGREPDRVLATVLFTDIVSSTERAAALGDRRWRDLMRTHDQLVERQLERHRGRPVKTLGDGYLAAFDGPARAIRCACAIREQVRQLGVEIRAGLHTGECELIGADLSGLAVNIGARVGAKAGGGEVLVSSTVKDLVAGSGIEFAERGTHELKGVPGEWRLYAVGGG